jgi:endonuclease III
MAPEPLSIPAVLEKLESFHGIQEPCWPVDPFEFLVWWHCGYPASDQTCARGWAALTSEAGVEPEAILAAGQQRLARALKAGGMVPDVRAARLLEIAERVRNECGGDLRAALAGHVAGARKLLRKFPGIQDPGADRVLLFGRIAPVAAVPSNCPHVLVRIRSGDEGTNYGATYRDAQAAIEAEVPREFHARTRAYLLLKVHGQKLCKRTSPKCSECPVQAGCAYGSKNRG